MTQAPSVTMESAGAPTRTARLLYVVNNPRFFVSHRLALAAAARDAGYEVHVATPRGEDVAAITNAGFAYHPLRLDRGGLRPLDELWSIVSIVRLYRTVRPHLLHHVTVKPVLYGGIAARLLGVPGVVHGVTGLGWIFIARGVRATLIRKAVRIAYRVVFGHPNSRAIFQNPDDLAEFTHDGLLSTDRAVLIKGSGVDLNLFVPSQEPSGVPVVLFASRMLWDKGVGDFVEVARMFQRRGIGARFVLAGDTDEANPHAVPVRTLQEWHDEGVIAWQGHRNDMQVALANSHIVCLPSRYREGVPRVLIEAAASGRPIVTTDTPGCREIVRAGRNGLLIPPHDIPALEAALEQLIRSPGLRCRMGAAGRDLAQAEFGLDRVLAETIRVYRDLVSPRIHCAER